ncbi:hypothetical protein COHA_009957 [Chlorella ohadii]|uniref:Uncharacterized protein n=1 Tax=Chlorella ohadii TaxID=2649997 RepID=A0AAD5DEJ3_9CHLO|nr:hypothetical protein COHA_009957 [Chlorella ohadii]
MRSCDSCVPAKLRLSVTNSERTGAGPLMLLLLGLLLLGLLSLEPADNANKTSKGIRREDEPEEYWSSKGEREGKNPLSDPLAQIGILAILFPFIFLAIAIAFGLVDLSGGR